MADNPIEPQNYPFGLNVVDIGDIRVTRGKTKRPQLICRHRNMNYDREERRIYCPDCETDVDPFDAFMALVENWDAVTKAHIKKSEALNSALKFQIRARATKVIDEVWRQRKVVPMCPACNQGLLPEDFVNGVDVVSKEWALSARKARLNKK